MEHAIFLNTAVAVRSEANERAEMVTQLLFGDTCYIINERESFFKIRNYSDNYIGWVDKKMLSTINLETYNKINAHPKFRTNVPLADVFCLSDKSIYKLSLGSLLPLYNYETNNFEIADKKFQIHPSFVTYLPKRSKENILSSAMLFLNSPYLWGGKTIFGIDCSGFVQVVYYLNGYFLPRDASLQWKEGKIIASLTEAQPSDLIFFEKNGRITHVGIYMGDNKIIHASGKVRIDKVDEQGIYNEDISAYTHRLASIKRI